MKYQRCIWTVLAALVLLGALASSESRAQTYGTYPTGPFVYTPPIQYPGWTYVPIQPYYYSYVEPYPAYGILPPFFMNGRQGYGYDSSSYANPAARNPYGAHKTAEDYGYTRDYFDQPPRKRSTLSPALPFQAGPKDKVEDPETTARRVKIEVTVPTPDASVLIDGAKTTQTGLQRTFVTPPLEEKKYTMTVEVHWTDGEGKVHQDKASYEFSSGWTLHYPQKKLK